MRKEVRWHIYRYTYICTGRERERREREREREGESRRRGKDNKWGPRPLLRPPRCSLSHVLSLSLSLSLSLFSGPTTSISSHLTVKRENIMLMSHCFTLFRYIMIYIAIERIYSRRNILYIIYLLYIIPGFTGHTFVLLWLVQPQLNGQANVRAVQIIFSRLMRNFIINIYGRA